MIPDRSELEKFVGALVSISLRSTIRLCSAARHPAILGTTALYLAVGFADLGVASGTCLSWTTVLQLRRLNHDRSWIASDLQDVLRSLQTSPPRVNVDRSYSVPYSATLPYSLASASS